ncbi:MAG: tRNA 4-thiouridine(8) synthase ThiI [Erysipelotrichaceae bacterium]|nr:tRNA 4-thiouridine(8) synthase ThiI [Erysipelotrichaceae bacterium]MBQ7889249.1 tRNA 4-thiouridine(8) synthase ThiI [Erysipelotrichaceae bacterium]
MELVYDHILVRYGELSTKGKNRKDFIRRLTSNIKLALSGFDQLTYEQTFDRIYIHLHGTPFDEVSPILKEVFGISSFSPTLKVESDLNTIKEAALMVANSTNGHTFKMETRRHDKKFPHRSDEINRACAGKILANTEWKVDVHHPDLHLRVEVREKATYIMPLVVQGAGGYPTGIGGKAMLLLSGGIDSPVAGYLTMKRGIEIEAVHFSSPPYTSDLAKGKVLDLASQISVYQGQIKVHVVPFTDLQLAIYKNCNESYAITIMRRMMVRIADRLAQRRNCMALVTGESVGQVASQTLNSMQTINDVTTMPILRPVVTYDKLEIIDVAKKINTYETSILPYEDCCTIFTPKNPVTKPTIKRAVEMESHFDFEPLIEECLNNIETVIMTVKKQEEDLF